MEVKDVASFSGHKMQESPAQMSPPEPFLKLGLEERNTV